MKGEQISGRRMKHVESVSPPPPRSPAVPYGNFGCSGGNMYNSYMYVIANEGVDTEKWYSYNSRVR